MIFEVKIALIKPKRFGDIILTNNKAPQTNNCFQCVTWIPQWYLPDIKITYDYDYGTYAYI